MDHKEIEAERLTIYCTETDRYGTAALYEWLLSEALELELAGATATRAVAGFGQRHRMHHQHLLSLSDTLPVMVQVIDTAANIDRYLDKVAGALIGYTYIRERVRYHQPNT